MGPFALGVGFRGDSTYSVGLASVVQNPASANGDMAFPLPDLSIDAGVWCREVVERRSDMAKFDGIELSLRDAASADTAGLVHASSASICSEDVRRRSIRNRTGRAVFVSDHTTS